MRIYLDDDSVDRLLVRLLHGDGHDVQTPSDAGMVGETDPIQLAHAVQTDQVLLSHNHDDFWDLHRLVTATSGAHRDILIVRRDNDRRRDMTARGIVRAVDRLLASGAPIDNEFIILNHWR